MYIIYLVGTKLRSFFWSLADWTWFASYTGPAVAWASSFLGYAGAGLTLILPNVVTALVAAAAARHDDRGDGLAGADRRGRARGGPRGDDDVLTPATRGDPAMGEG